MSVIRAFNFPCNPGETCYSAQDEGLLKLCASGKTLKEIGAILGLHDSAVFYRLKKLGKTDCKVKKSPRISHLLKGKEAEICQMYKAGLNTYKIAKNMGGTSKSIYNVLINQGLSQEGVLNA